jgi:hypothetical protein
MEFFSSEDEAVLEKLCEDTSWGESAAERGGYIRIAR